MDPALQPCKIEIFSEAKLLYNSFRHSFSPSHLRFSNLPTTAVTFLSLCSWSVSLLMNILGSCCICFSLLIWSQFINFVKWWYLKVTHHTIFQGHTNNIHCLAHAVNQLLGCLFSLGGHDDTEDRLKEFLALASSSLLRLGQEASPQETKNRESVYILLHQIVQVCWAEESSLVFIWFEHDLFCMLDKYLYLLN